MAKASFDGDWVFKHDKWGWILKSLLLVPAKDFCNTFQWWSLSKVWAKPRVRVQWSRNTPLVLLPSLRESPTRSEPGGVSPGWWRLGFELVSSPDMAALQDVSWSFHTVWAHRCLRASSWFTMPLVAWCRHTCYVLMRQLLASSMSKQKWTRVLFIHFIPRLFYTVLAA